jgi:hypothetical protein
MVAVVDFELLNKLIGKHEQLIILSLPQLFNVVIARQVKSWLTVAPILFVSNELGGLVNSELIKLVKSNRYILTSIH